jgi:hypothetical protein
MAVRSLLTGQKELADFFKEFPERVQRRIARHAVKKAGQALTVRASVLTPVDMKKRSRMGPENPSDTKNRFRPWHSKDWYISVSRNKKNLAKQIVGIQSHKSPQKHLFEFGTNGRWTEHGTPRRQYRRVSGGGTYMKNQKYTTADGKIRTKKVLVQQKPQYRSAGSTLRREGDINGKSAGVVGRMKWRGRMPAYKPLTRSFSQMSSIMLRIIEDETRKGLQRAAMRAGAESDG